MAWVVGGTQVLLAVTLLLVWLVRPSMATAYRGGEARTLRDEFRVYGLPAAMFWVVGALKVSIGVALLVGFWVPELVLPAAALLCVLMLGAVLMHIKVRDAALKSLPAALMLVGSLLLLAPWLGV